MREVSIKGVRQGIVLVLPDDQGWDDVCEQLDSKLVAASSLIQGSKAQLDVGDRAVTPDQLAKLVAHLSGTYQLESVALIGSQTEARSAAEACGLPMAESAPAMPAERFKTPPPQSPPPPPEPPVVGNNALYMRQTIRSGQSVRHDGTVIICGDVNPGAEVIATGDIIVFGTLRGVAHAGAAGAEDSQIIAINLRPTQIRIASYIARSPDHSGPPLSKFPEVARVSDSEIHIIPLRDAP